MGAFTRTPAEAGKAQPAVGAHFGDAGKHGVSAFGCLDRQHPASGDNCALPCVEGRQRSEEARAKRNVRLVLFGRRARANRAGRREEARSDFMRANHPDALALYDRGKTGEQPVVAAAKQLR